VLVDHFSRRVLGVAVFQKQPDAQAVRSFFGRTIARAKATPKYIVCDRGPQFDCQGFMARRRTRFTTATSPRTAARASSRARAGRAARHVQGPGPWSAATRARS